MIKKLGIAIVGCGQFGNKRAQAVATNQHARLVGVFDPDQDRANQVAATHSVTSFTSMTELLNHPEVDGVVISSPNYLHASQSIVALARRKHVLCEKPAGICRQDFVDLLNQIEKNDHAVNWQYGYNHRFFDPIIQLRHWLDSSAIGELQTIELAIASSRNKDASPWFTNHQLSGGGTLIDNGHHVIDLLLWLVPGRWHVVSAICSPHSSTSVETDASLQLNQGTISATITSQWHSAPHYLSIRVKGQTGTITITDETATLATTATTIHTFPLVPGSAVRAEIDNWLTESIDHPKVSAQKNVAMAAAIYDLIATAYSLNQHDTR